jgi:hypothetical protein
MSERRPILLLCSFLVISLWVLGSAAQAGAETMNYKVYTWVSKGENYPVGDVEGHNIGVHVRGAFYAFENGDVATAIVVGTFDWIKGKGPFVNYVTMNFADGSTIMIKTATAATGEGQWASEIIKGTGRFDGIKGKQSTSKFKFLPVEKGEAGPKGYGEGALTFTLPSK